jgi:F-type H+-transporting ATPase subunit delta
MAELATIARPYAEALFKAVGGSDAQALKAQMAALATVAATPSCASSPTTPRWRCGPGLRPDRRRGPAARACLDAKVGNLLRTVIENGRLAALPEIAAQFQALVNASSGVSDATVYSAFPIDDAHWPT